MQVSDFKRGALPRVIVLLAAACSSGPTEEEIRAKNAREIYGDPNVPGTRAYKAAHPPPFDPVRLPEPGDKAKAKAKPEEVEHDLGCPVAARRLIKRMGTCGINADGLTENYFCGASSKIDSKVVRFLADTEDCGSLKVRMQIGD